MNVSLEEQETHITWSRGDKYAQIYTSDSTTMTKLDRKVKEHPEVWSILSTESVSGEIVSKTYKCPRKLVSFRNCVVQRDFQGNSEALKRWREQKAQQKT